jgi:hypothetical protein
VHRSIKLGVLFCASGKNHASSPLRKLPAAALTIIDLCQSMPAAHCNKTAFQAIAATQRVAPADRSHRRLGDPRRRGPYLPRFAPSQILQRYAIVPRRRVRRAKWMSRRPERALLHSSFVSAGRSGAAVLAQLRARYLVESKKQGRQRRRLPASTPTRNATVTA